MMSASFPGTWVAGEPVGWEDKLPGELALSLGILTRHGRWEFYCAKTVFKIILMKRPDLCDLCLKRLRQCRGKHGDPIFVPFSLADKDSAMPEIQILDPQPDALHESHSRTVQQMSHEAIDTRQVAQDVSDLRLGEDGWQAFRLSSPQRIDVAERKAQHFAIQVKQC